MEEINKKSASENSLNEFFLECEEISSRLTLSFNDIEKNNYAKDLIDSVYRDIHTLKGSAQLFGFSQLGDLAHTMESSMDPIRRQEAKPSKSLISALFKCIDLIDRMVICYQKSEQIDYSNELNILIPTLVQASVGTVNGNLVLENEFPRIAEVIPLTVQAPEQIRTENTVVETQSDSLHAATLSKNDEQSSIRVSVQLLDRLMTLMGEMVLVRNQVLQYANSTDNLEFLNLSQRLNVVTSELQDEMMKTRMQPIGNILTKFHRVVRDLTKELGKKIELQLNGVETELDKSLLEVIKDPLTHIIRNACDHGIESPNERRKFGKSETGTISVRAFHESGQVIIDILDDGKGLDRSKILAKAVEKNLVPAEKIKDMPDREILNLIFAPGFSTAAKVTNISGRGVGMDIVKSNIDKIGGAVELSSETGKSTEIKIKIPLTLAIVPAMIVRCKSEYYAIPQLKLVELVRVDKNDSANKIEYLQGRPIYQLRGNILPLVDFKGVLKHQAAESELGSQDIFNIVVLNAENQTFGLIVDEIQDTADIVVKPLNSVLKAIEVYSGATVLGDGSIALILDVLGIARQQELLSVKAPEVKQKDQIVEKEEKESELQEFLLFKVQSPTKHAILLSYVHRLEEFKKSSIELYGSQRVVRYRNLILPIISLNEVFGLDHSGSKDQDILSVIVVQYHDRLCGIEVNEILDVLSTQSQLDLGFSDRAGILGNFITNEEVIVVIDQQRILNNVFARLSSDIGEAQKEDLSHDELSHQLNKITQTSFENGSTKARRILFVEDSVFFRRYVSSVLEKSGHTVVTANNGHEAIEILKKSSPGSLDLILSDIEMPKVNGLQLAATVRKDPAWRSIPMIALSTLAQKRNVDEGIQAGFNRYLEKMDPEQLLHAIQKICEPRETRIQAVA